MKNCSGFREVIWGWRWLKHKHEVLSSDPEGLGAAFNRTNQYFFSKEIFM
jgi:hypothetical protein